MHTRTWFVLASLCSLTASAASVTGKIEGPKGPVANATVRVWQAAPAFNPCPASGPNDWGLRKCLCAGKLDAVAKTLAAAPAATPLATATSGADGRFALDVSIDKDQVLTVSASDGALAASGRAEIIFVDGAITLGPAATPRVKLTSEEGLDLSRASVFAIDSSTGSVVPMTRDDGGVWSASGLPPGNTDVVALVPGAAPAVERLLQTGRPLYHRHPGRVAPPIPELSVGRYQHVEGTLTRDGKPVAGVTVVAAPEGCAYATRSDARGHFQFETGEPEPFLTPLAASQPGYLAKATGYASKPNELELVKAGVLDATFSGPDHNPVPGLGVQLDWRRDDNNQTDWRQVTTDARGKVHAEFAGSGMVHVRLRSTDWAFAKTRAAQVPSGATVRSNFELARATRLDVEVVDGAGKPLPDLYVRVYFGEELQSKMPRDLKEALLEQGHTTNSRGVCALTGLLPGGYEVGVEDRMLGRASATGTAPGKIRLQLGNTPILRVTVADEAGTPIEGARLNIKEGNNSHGAVTDAAGVAQLALGPGTYEVRAMLPGAPREGVLQTAELKEKTTVDLKFTGKALPRVRGTVVDSSGKPVPNAKVFASAGVNPFGLMPGVNQAVALRSWEMQVEMMARSGAARILRADAKGEFVAPPGDGTKYWAEADGYASMGMVEPKEGAVRLVLVPRPVAVGRVVSAAGRPVRGAQVGGATTDADGAFRATLFDDGENRLTVSAQGHPSRMLEVTAKEGDKDVTVGDVPIENGVSLKGSVVDALTQQLVPSVRIEVQWGPEQTERQVGITQADGHFEVQGVPVRPLELRAELGNYATTVMAVPKPGPGLKVSLSPLATLDLRVFDHGKPAAQIEVHAEGPARDGTSPWDRRQPTTDALGTVRLTDLKAGTWTFTFQRSNAPWGKTATLTLKPGEKKTFTVEQ